MTERLAPGVELRCPHCGRWHAITKYPGTEGTAYTLEMMFFECMKGRYYAGQIGGAARFPTRLGTVDGPRA